MHQLIYRMNCDDVFTHIELEETKTYKKKKNRWEEQRNGTQNERKNTYP